MRTSIIVAAHNEGPALAKTIGSCIKTCEALDYEIVVADDASTDDSVQRAVAQFPQVRVTRHDRRRGASPTKHLGACEAQGDVLVFLDGHCKPEEGAVRRLVEDVELLDGEAIVTPAIPALDVGRWRNNPRQVGHGYRMGLKTFDGGWLPLGRMRAVPEGRRQFHESPALIGCALAVSRTLYDRLNGFDAGMLMWGVEDLDFGLKCWLLGARILHDAKARIGHRFRKRFDNYQVPGEHVIVNQLRSARKNFTYSVWAEWVDRCRRRHPGRLADHPEGLWARVWQLFEENRSSVEEERSYVQASRVRDEFWYAQRFGLAWPSFATGDAPKPGGFRSLVQAQASPSPSPSPWPSPSPSPSPPPDEWKAWPGGQTDASLNPTEAFSSTDFGFTDEVDWDVGGGGVAAVIVETGTTTATGRETITVRYDTKSPTAAVDDTAWVQATKGGETKTKKRTVFKVTWSLKFDGDLHADDNLRFFRTGGTDTDKCEFNWDGENGATRTTAKMEATLDFSPTGIKWSARGVSFKYSTQAGSKFSCRLHRRKISTSVCQEAPSGANRYILMNDAGWVYDGNSDAADAQHPTDAKPNKAFRIDEPSFDAAGWLQFALRVDFREVAQWHNGSGWSQISVSSEGEWYANETSVLPNGAKGGTNDQGSGGAENVPNTKPVADAGFDQTVGTGEAAQLFGFASSDADNDTLTYQWAQTAGTPVTLSDATAENPTFTAPGTAGTLKFALKVKDITAGLHHHQPTNSESDADGVTITVE
jgi:glycosyltransferase involved in cell wall biosynthesis